MWATVETSEGSSGEGGLSSEAGGFYGRVMEGREGRWRVGQDCGGVVPACGEVKRKWCKERYKLSPRNPTFTQMEFNVTRV